MRFISCPKGAERKEQYKKKMQVPTSNDKQEIPGLAPDDGFVPAVFGVKPTSHISSNIIVITYCIIYFPRCHQTYFLQKSFLHKEDVPKLSLYTFQLTRTMTTIYKGGRLLVYSHYKCILKANLVYALAPIKFLLINLLHIHLRILVA